MQYPFVELITGLVFVLVVSSQFSPGGVVNFLEYSSTTLVYDVINHIQLITHLLIWSLLIVIAVYDFRTKIVPNRFSYSFAVLALVSMSFESIAIALSAPTSGTVISVLISNFLAGPLLFAPFYVLWKASNGRWIGLGDGKLALGIGWYLGLSGGFSAILLGFWIGAIYGLTTILFSKVCAVLHNTGSWGRSFFPGDIKRLTMKSEVPFGPFLVLGTALVFFFAVSATSLFI